MRTSPDPDPDPDDRGAGLETVGLTVAYGPGAPAVDAVDLVLPCRTITAIIGPNGSGKSTLLRAAGRLLAPTAGRVLLDGHDIARRPTRELARHLGILPQSPLAPEGLTVIDLVSRGRDPHRRWFDQWARSDEDVVRTALARTGLLDDADRLLDELSGGQRQRAWIAMALAQQAGTLLLDEPTTHLDLAHQIDVLDLVRAMHAEYGATVVMVLHDLGLAARYADRIVALHDGRVVAQGTPAEVLTPELLRTVFDITATVLTDPHTGRPYVLPIGRADPHPA